MKSKILFFMLIFSACFASVKEPRDVTKLLKVKNPCFNLGEFERLDFYKPGFVFENLCAENNISTKELFETILNPNFFVSREEYEELSVLYPDRIRGKTDREQRITRIFFEGLHRCLNFRAYSAFRFFYYFDNLLKTSELCTIAYIDIFLKYRCYEKENLEYFLFESEDYSRPSLWGISQYSDNQWILEDYYKMKYFRKVWEDLTNCQEYIKKCEDSFENNSCIRG